MRSEPAAKVVSSTNPIRIDTTRISGAAKKPNMISFLQKSRAAQVMIAA
jgi:hypothetical protein